MAGRLDKPRHPHLFRIFEGGVSDKAFNRMSLARDQKTRRREQQTNRCEASNKNSNHESVRLN